MASFVGSFDEFKRYINQRVKNVVNALSRTHKQEVGKCEHCECTAQTLEAAHVTGRERPKIIEEVLLDFTNGEVVTVDLEVFENRLKQAHDPISEVILALCRACHQQYDAVTSQPEDVLDVNMDENITEDIRPISNSDVTDYFRSHVPLMNKTQLEELLSLAYCREYFGVQFSVLKEIPAGANQEAIRSLAQVNGYNRWSTRNPIVTNYGSYLVSTQWYESSRKAFQRWLKIQDRELK